MYWPEEYFARWREVLLTGLFAREKALTTGRGYPRQLSAGAVWDYLWQVSAVGPVETEAFGESRVAAAEVAAVWEEVAGAFSEHLETGEPVELELEEGLRLEIYGFRPEADVYEYYVTGRPTDRLVAVLRGPRRSVALEATGEFAVVVEEGRRRIRYAGTAPRRVIELIRLGRLRPEANPWFALRSVKDGEAADDLWVGYRLPKDCSALREFMSEHYATSFSEERI